MEWKLLTFLVCCFGFCKDLRPSEAYMTTFLTSDWKNITLDQVNNEIYPWWTYSYAIWLIPVFVFTDYFRYRSLLILDAIAYIMTWVLILWAQGLPAMTVMIWLIPVFVFTDYFRYRSLLILDAIAYIMTWVLILWAQGLPAMTVMQVSYGLATAGEIGYFSYLYSMVEKTHFQTVASFTRCASLSGRFTAYLLGQFLISYDILDLFELNAFSFASVSLAFAISIILPKSKTSSSTPDSEIGINVDIKSESDYSNARQNNHRSNSSDSERNKSYTDDMKVSDIEIIPGDTENAGEINDNTSTLDPAIVGAVKETTGADHQPKADTSSMEVQNENTESQDVWNSIKRLKTSIRLFKEMKETIRQTYSSRTVIVWSLWWITASCGNLQIGSYIQNLWEAIAPHKERTVLYNGAVEAAGTLAGSLSVVLVGFLSVKWSRTGRSEILMASVCAIKAIILAVMATTTEIWVAYILYDVFRVLYQVTITIETAEIAKALTNFKYAFVFGCNMFLALVIESVFTAVVVDQSGFGVDIRTQFLAYSVYSAVLSVIFFVVAIATVCRKSTADQTKDVIQIWSTNL